MTGKEHLYTVADEEEDGWEESEDMGLEEDEDEDEDE
jgi:hypothetical protein